MSEFHGQQADGQSRQHNGHVYTNNYYYYGAHNGISSEEATELRGNPWQHDQARLGQWSGNSPSDESSQRLRQPEGIRPSHPVHVIDDGTQSSSPTAQPEATTQIPSQQPPTQREQTQPVLPNFLRSISTKDQEPLNDNLLEACKDGDLDKMKDAITLGADVNCRDQQHNRPLHCACKTGRPDLVAELLLHGADIEARGGGHLQPTPLTFAVGLGEERAVRELLFRGADVDGRDGHLHTALHRASEKLDINIARILLEAGADVNSKAKGETPLDRALVQGNKDGAEAAFEQLLREQGGKKQREVALEKAPWLTLLTRVLDRTSEHLEGSTKSQTRSVQNRPKGLRRQGL